MKNLTIKAYRDGQGPVFVLLIPKVDTDKKKVIDEIISEIINRILSNKPEGKTLTVDLKIKYDDSRDNYSLSMTDDRHLTSLKREFMGDARLQQMGLQQHELRKRLLK